ncbi:histidine phosphatase superfamily [Lipomyces oligophaga]|uniref:histidine phosphatase superfamily n=1 Tax=Lipomyces oligophaga TaxID=45792 RepID=UPI0034CFDE43
MSRLSTVATLAVFLAFASVVLAAALSPNQVLFSYDDNSNGEWSLFDHLGGYSPWIPHTGIKGAADLDNSSIPAPLPESCTVNQVHLLSRHFERYPTRRVGMTMKSLVERMRLADRLHRESHKNTPLFPFLKSWKLFFDVDMATGHSEQLEQLTTRGKYAGTVRAREAGKLLRSRYLHLIPMDAEPNPYDVLEESYVDDEEEDGWPETGQHKHTSIYSCSCDRVMDTARAFGAGFFGSRQVRKSVRHVVIPDYAPSRGGDTLTPVKACSEYREDPVVGRQQGPAMAEAYKSEYLRHTSSRLRDLYDFEFSHSDLWTMQELCGFEILATGKDTNPWCEMFTHEEWAAFEYARDVLHYYRTGPGTPYSEVMGFLYLNATAYLLEHPDEVDSKLFLSFAHDGDLVPLITALGLFRDQEPLPASHLVPDREWRLSTVVPMGGRIVFERVSCGTASSADSTGVRLLVNDAVTPIPGCQDQEICPLDEFLDIIKATGLRLQSFEDVCGIDSEVTGKRPSFFFS